MKKENLVEIKKSMQAYYYSLRQLGYSHPEALALVIEALVSDTV